MDDLRFALLIVGIVVVAAIYAFTRFSHRKATMRRDESDPVTWESRDEVAYDPDESARPEPRLTGDATDTEVEIDRLGGVFAPTRERSDAELSVDIDILAGLRATYESTLDGTREESAGPQPSVDGDAAAPLADAVATAPLAIDMTRPLIYLTLVGKQPQVSGRMVLDALDAEGFRPGLMQLYYWRSDAEPSVTFGVANMVEPGVLDPDELPGVETPGLVTFMSVPKDAASAFRILDTMVATSRRLARRIDATLCDETRSTLTAQAETHLREKVADILRQDRVQG